MSPHDSLSTTLAEPFENLKLSESLPKGNFYKLGLDHGTTYTAIVVYLYSGKRTQLQPELIFPIRNYCQNEAGGGKAGQVASVIRYIFHDASQEIKFGENALAMSLKPGYTIRRAKLGLDGRRETELYRTQTLRKLKELPVRKTLVNVISDFLTQVFRRVKNELDDLGYNSRDSLELNYAAPLEWSCFSHRDMAEAIAQAAQAASLVIDKGIKVWPEPEAALEHILTLENRPSLQADDVFTVCDAGGGTVDLTTYRVVKIAPLRLEEYVEGKGILCGSTFLDEGFERLLRNSIRAETEPDYQLIEPQIHYICEHFRKVYKTNFEYSQNQPFEILLPGYGALGEICISSDDIKPLFDDIAERIMEAILGQVRSSELKGCRSKLVVLTGGLSGSRFVREHIKNGIRDENARTKGLQAIEFKFPEPMDYGVAAGTILCSNKNNTADRTERLNMVSIGIPVSEKYDRDNTKHTAIGVQRFRNVYDNKDWVDGVMNWLLTKGERQQRGSKIIRLRREIPAEVQSTHEVDIQMYGCNHAETEPYPMSHYEAMNKPCFFWANVVFEVDMARVRAQLKPKKSKLPTKPRLTKVLKPQVPCLHHPIHRTRSSARSGPPSPATPCLCDTENDADTDDDVSEPSSSLLSPEKEAEPARLYYDFWYSISIEFDGMEAKYKLLCDIQDPVLGRTVKLPGSYGHHN